MVFEGADGTFSSIRTVFFGGDSLVRDVVLHEGVFKILGAFVVQDVEIGGMALMDQRFMSFFPSIADAGSLAIGNGNGMDRISVLMV